MLMHAPKISTTANLCCNFWLLKSAKTAEMVKLNVRRFPTCVQVTLRWRPWPNFYVYFCFFLLLFYLLILLYTLYLYTVRMNSFWNLAEKINWVPAVPRKRFGSADCDIIYSDTLSICISEHKQLIRTFFRGTNCRFGKKISNYFKISFSAAKKKKKFLMVYYSSTLIMLKFKGCRYKKIHSWRKFLLGQVWEGILKKGKLSLAICTLSSKGKRQLFGTKW